MDQRETAADAEAIHSSSGRRRLAAANRASRMRALRDALGLCALFTALVVAAQIFVGAYQTDHGQFGDESAYFVTSLMIADYLRLHLFANPIAYAYAYYAHFPRITLGHHQPMFQAVQAAVFVIFGGGTATAAALQAVVAGLFAGLPAAIVASSSGLLAGFSAGLVLLCAPVVCELAATDMADLFLGVAVLLATLAWSRLYRQRTGGAAMLFAACASIAILTKGSALGLALLPPLHLAMKRDLRFLLDRKCSVAALLVAAATLPWYLLTYKAAAAGFGYSWGWGYTRVAVPQFARMLTNNLGIAVVALFLAGFVMAARDRRAGGSIDVHALGASSLCMALAVAIVPASVTPRYLVPAFPGTVAVAFWALARIAGQFRVVARNRPLALAFGPALTLLTVASVFERPHLDPLRPQVLTADILAAGKPNPLVLVGTGSTIEGAVIATFAEQDRSLSHYVVRGTEVLSSSDFMGGGYRPRFANAAEMADWIRRNEIGWIIVEKTREAEMAHIETLQEAIEKGLLGARLVAVTRARSNDVLELYILPAADKSPRPSDGVFAELKPSHAF